MRGAAERKCRISGCPATAVAHGLCPKHFMRQRRTGDPTVKRKPGPKAKRPQVIGNLSLELLALQEEVAALRSRVNALEQQAAGRTDSAIAASSRRDLMKHPDRRARPPMDFIERLEPEFRFAKTLAHIPHYWVRRTPQNEADFVALYNAIEPEDKPPELPLGDV